jgi:hypothetical protein
VTSQFGLRDVHHVQTLQFALQGMRCLSLGFGLSSNEHID